MVLQKLLLSKIHNIKVTEANLRYIGSITLDVDFLEKSGITPWSEVFIVNNNNGARIETYVIPGERGKQDVCLNGAAARLFEEGDEIIIMHFGHFELPFNRKKSEQKQINNFFPKVLLAEYSSDGKELVGLTEHDLRKDEMKIWKGTKFGQKIEEQ